jgi:hypothetical protein
MADGLVDVCKVFLTAAALKKKNRAQIIKQAVGFELCITDTKECLMDPDRLLLKAIFITNFNDTTSNAKTKHDIDKVVHEKKLSQCHFDFAYPVDHPLISHPPSTPVPLLTWWWWILIILWYSETLFLINSSKQSFHDATKVEVRVPLIYQQQTKKYELHQKLVQFVFFKSHKTAQQQNASSFIACESNGPNTTTTIV